MPDRRTSRSGPVRVQAQRLISALAMTSVALLVTFMPATDSSASNALKVVIIRHGEKPESGENLSCQGENRALALPAVLTSKFGTLDYAYVPALGLGKTSTHARMFQTLTPLAIKQGLSVNSKYTETDVSGVANDVLKRTGVVLLVWDHSRIPALAQALGVSHPPPWSGDDFDSIWVISIAPGPMSMSIDSQGITPSSQCSY